ncbi:MAG: hypothetical protein DRJ51_02630 [Thermoprotei archaeon]|nr:MAG: hypothetical protein DRJ51_02630 [Thermoprotei archaeon]
MAIEVESNERVKKLAELKTYLEKRIRDLENEIELLRTVVGIINEKLANESFKPASALLREEITAREERPSVPEVEARQETKIYSRKLGGEVIGKMVIFEDKIVLRPLKKVNVRDPLFRNFFLNSILEKMRRDDEERVLSGELEEEKALKYKVRQTPKGFLEEVIVWNVYDERRLRELKGSFRWMVETLLLKKRRAE